MGSPVRLLRVSVMPLVMASTSFAMACSHPVVMVLSACSFSPGSLSMTIASSQSPAFMIPNPGGSLMGAGEGDGGSCASSSVNKTRLTVLLLLISLFPCMPLLGGVLGIFFPISSTCCVGKGEERGELIFEHGSWREADPQFGQLICLRHRPPRVVGVAVGAKVGLVFVFQGDVFAVGAKNGKSGWGASPVGKERTILHH